MEYLMEKISSSDPQPIKLDLLKAITDDFSEKMKIGNGGYGHVYKGVLNGEEIAVKKLFSIHGLDDEGFENEFRILKKVQHKNIIRMIAYCYEISHRDVEYQGQIVWSQVIDRALCFEYMKGGSLAQHISVESCIHDWLTTYKIISGICEGLHHLHNGGETKIVHMDLNPGNVLLNEELVPKIEVFGFSMLLGSSDTVELSSLKGTIGFMPPEYVTYNKVSEKNDVFALGVIIFHMMAGAKRYGDYQDARHHPTFSLKIQPEFIESVQEYWKTKMQASKGYRWDETDLLGITECIEMAMRCVEDDPDKRPLTTEIMGELKELDSKMEMLKEDLKPLIRHQMGYKLNDMSTGSKPHHLTLQHLKDITGNFSNERILGIGSFGVVYKGVLPSGEVVAVKKLLQARRISQKQFENEDNLMNLDHPNIVRLVGYCYETQRLLTPHEGKFVIAWNTESLLCLEYLPNGSLHNYISDASSGLDWRTRWEIIEGICFGLKYLHEQSNGPIIHMDLKPANILLNGNMVPKIADFGLSRLFYKKHIISTATTSGTLGYMPPEYLQGIITPKSDIFSLGVIIMEVITGHREYPSDITTSSVGFIELELKKWRNVLQREPDYTSLEMSCQQIKRCIQIGLICVNPERTKRPTMKQIINMLQGLESMNLYITNELSYNDIEEEL